MIIKQDFDDQLPTSMDTELFYCHERSNGSHYISCTIEYYGDLEPEYALHYISGVLEAIYPQIDSFHISHHNENYFTVSMFDTKLKDGYDSAPANQVA